MKSNEVMPGNFFFFSVRKVLCMYRLLYHIGPLLTNGVARARPLSSVSPSAPTSYLCELMVLLSIWRAYHINTQLHCVSAVRENIYGLEGSLSR